MSTLSCCKLWIALSSLLLINSCGGTRPVHLEDFGGHFAACPDTPNCVSSQAAPSDKIHYIEPFEINVSPPIAWRALEETVAGYPGSEIVKAGGNYLYAEFTSKIMRYIDDVEFYLDGSKTIHVRSASRLGYGDMGVNRDRIETIRAKLRQDQIIH